MLVVRLVVLGLAAPLCNGTSFGKITEKTVTKVENMPSFQVEEQYRDTRHFSQKSMGRKPNKILASSEAYRVRIGKNLRNTKNKKMSSEEKEVIRKFETRRKQKIFEKNKKLRTEYSSNQDTQDSECQ